MTRNLNNTGIPLLNPQLHPGVFQVNLPPQPELRSLDSVSFQRSIPVDTSVPRRNFRLHTHGTTQDNFAHEMLRGSLEPNEIALTYFSNRNLKRIQNNLRHQVKIRTNHEIDDQDETVIKITMKTMYMQYSLNPVLPHDPVNARKVIIAAVKRLNLYVLQDILPQTISGIEQYLGYLRDASTNPMPINQPLSMSVKGTKNLRDMSDIIFATPFDVNDVVSG